MKMNLKNMKNPQLKGMIAKLPLNDELLKHCEVVVLSILTIPHSSAHCERVFSTVRKNRTEQRSSLSDKTLEALLVMKSRPAEAGTRHFSEEKTLKGLKSAYYQSLVNKT